MGVGSTGRVLGALLAYEDNGEKRPSMRSDDVASESDWRRAACARGECDRPQRRVRQRRGGRRGGRQTGVWSDVGDGGVGVCAAPHIMDGRHSAKTLPNVCVTSVCCSSGWSTWCSALFGQWVATSRGERLQDRSSPARLHVLLRDRDCFVRTSAMHGTTSACDTVRNAAASRVLALMFVAVDRGELQCHLRLTKTLRVVAVVAVVVVVVVVVESSRTGVGRCARAVVSTVRAYIDRCCEWRCLVVKLIRVCS